MDEETIALIWAGLSVLVIIAVGEKYYFLAVILPLLLTVLTICDCFVVTVTKGDV
jgi:hypothetical protein